MQRHSTPIAPPGRHRRLVDPLWICAWHPTLT